MNLIGKIIEIYDTQQVSDRFKKREFVVEYAENPQYPDFVKFELLQDKCNIIDDYAVGSMVNVSFNVRGRKWTDPKNGETKYFNTLAAWRLESVDGNSSSQGGSLPEPPPFDDLGSDLPF